jgi:hypothetical protein
MPRRRRDDYEPRLLLPAELRAAQQRASDAVAAQGFGATAWPKGQRLSDGWTMTFDETKRVISRLRQTGVPLDFGLLHWLMQCCPKAVEAADPSQANVPDGRTRVILKSVGCRVYMTQQQIAVEFRCSR